MTEPPKQSQPPLNGCHNREPFRESLEVQDGWRSVEIGLETVRVPRMKVIEFRNSKDCRYSKDNDDPRCTGCKWNQWGKNHEPPAKTCP